MTALGARRKNRPETRRRVYCKPGTTIEERLLVHSTAAPSGCRIWLAARDVHGYGRIGVGGKVARQAHRIAYETWVGPIPDGLHIDHLCRRPACIRPDHLQAVPQRVNTLRGTGPSARAARRDICLRGHSYAEDAYTYRGKRYCRKCRRISDANRAAAKAAA